MLKYLIMRLESGALNYFTVTRAYPQYKGAIDTQLAADGYVATVLGDVIKAEKAFSQ